MSTEEHEREPATRDGEPEPHFADVGSVSDAAFWLATAVVSGVVGNAAYDVLKDQAKALLRRFGRRPILDAVHKELPGRSAHPDLPPAEIERRCVELLDRAEED